MIRALFDKLEDPTKPLLGPNYWLLKITFMIFPKNQLLKILCIIYLQIGTVYTITAFIELYIYLDTGDIDKILTNVKVTILGIIAIGKANSIIFGQKQWRKILTYVTEADNYERETSDEVRGNIIDTYTKYSRKITFLYSAIIITTFLTTISTPLVAVMSSETLRNNIRNGTEPFQHIFMSWVPFDKNSFPGNWVTVFIHVFSLFWGTGLLCALDSTILVVMIFVAAKFDLMRERSKQMFGTEGQGVSDDEAKKMVSELHLMHVTLVEHMKLFNALISPIMFTYVVVASLLICASAHQITLATSLGEKLFLFEFLLFCTVQIFLYCWHCSIVVEKMKKLMQGPYESEWWAGTASQRKSIIILMGQFSYVYTFTAGPFTKLTLASFVGMLKGAYSYFTLLRD